MENFEANIVISDEVRPDEGSPAIIAPVIIFKPEFVPTALTFAVTVIGIGINDNEEHKIKFQVVEDETQNVVYETAESSAVFPEKAVNFVISVELKNVGFKTEGKYLIRFNVDEKSAEGHFYILKRNN
ncbi:MAG: hypothetical protein LKK07_05015 [Lactococcus lactis]|jgi:hypothetical protein|nr:hypothetical protein [Lactococcus lactis]MCI2190043.1 hypothetical protein [Lactococcus lactis]